MLFIFFFNVPATTEIYTLSLHDALPILVAAAFLFLAAAMGSAMWYSHSSSSPGAPRSEEHTSELQSHSDLVCRLLLEKKKTNDIQASLPKPKVMLETHTNLKPTR